MDQENEGQKQRQLTNAKRFCESTKDDLTAYKETNEGSLIRLIPPAGSSTHHKI